MLASKFYGLYSLLFFPVADCGLALTGAPSRAPPRPAWPPGGADAGRGGIAAGQARESLRQAMHESVGKGCNTSALEGWFHFKWN